MSALPQISCRTKPVLGFEGQYDVLEDGRIWSRARINLSGKLRRGRFLKPGPGGEVILVSADGRKHRRLLSRVVAEAFVPNPDNLPNLLYIDENCRNRSAHNLYWSNEHRNCIPEGKMRAILHSVATTLGRSPTWTELETIAECLGTRVYLDNYLAYRGLTYNEFLTSQGCTPPPTLNSALCMKLDSLGYDYSPEFVIPGHKLRVDFEIKRSGTTVYLEVDGSSHFTTESVYLKRAAATKGVDVAELLFAKQERDRYVERWFLERSLPLHRVEYYKFMLMDRSEFDRMLDSQDVCAAPSRVTRRDRVAGWLGQGLTYKQIANLEGLTWQSVQSFARRSGLRHLRADRDAMFRKHRDMLHQLLAEGRRSMRSIARELGVSATVVRKWVAKLQALEA